MRRPEAARVRGRRRDAAAACRTARCSKRRSSTALFCSQGLGRRDATRCARSYRLARDPRHADHSGRAARRIEEAAEQLRPELLRRAQAEARRRADRTRAQGAGRAAARDVDELLAQVTSLSARATAAQDAMDRRPPEAERDQMESAFTPILRQGVERIAPSVLALAFVDHEGECIDYVSSLDPFEAKVCAAHALVLVDGLRAAREQARPRRSGAAVDRRQQARAVGAARERRLLAGRGARAGCGPHTDPRGARLGGSGVSRRGGCAERRHGSRPADRSR